MNVDLLFGYVIHLILLFEGGSGYDESDDGKALLLAARLNLALVYLKLNQCYEAKSECEKALEIDPQNVKGLFRRGQVG